MPSSFQISTFTELVGDRVHHHHLFGHPRQRTHLLLDAGIADDADLAEVGIVDPEVRHRAVVDVERVGRVVASQSRLGAIPAGVPRAVIVQLCLEATDTEGQRVLIRRTCGRQGFRLNCV